MNDGKLNPVDVVTEIMLEVFRLNASLLEKGDELVAPLGMTSARWQILGAIALSEQACSCPQIANAMGITRQGAQKQINLACKDGLIASCDNPRHARSPLYELTRAGKTAYNRAMNLEKLWAESLVKSISNLELKTALVVLKKLNVQIQSTSLPSERLAK